VANGPDLPASNELVMANASPLRLYDEIVGYVVLGYFLNRALSDEISLITQAKTHFFWNGGIFEDLAPSPNPGHRQVRATELTGVDGRGVRMALRLDNTFLDESSGPLTRSLIFFGCLCFFGLAALSYLLLDVGFVRKFQFILQH